MNDCNIGLSKESQLEKNNSSETTEPTPVENKGLGLKKNLFANLNTELKQALDSWDNLAQNVSTKKSPDEERLLEVKRILGELKSKLDQFED
jgi:hypothetical protein